MRSLIFWLLVSMQFPLALSAHAQDVLWRKAVAVAATSRHWIPTKMVTRFELLKEDGTVDHWRETWLQVTYDDSGRTHTKVTKALADGQDVTAEARRKEAERGSSRRRRSVGLDLGPFEPSKQDSVRVEPLGQTRTIEGRLCSGYQFTFTEDEKSSVHGQAWLDQVSGAPLLVTFEQDPLPKRVKEMRTTVFYTVDDSSRWYATEMRVEGKVGFLFIKKSFRTVVRFSDYRRRPGGGTE